jgi:hypothetical protein
MPIDFGLNFTDKRFLNKDGTFKKVRGYSNRTVLINNDFSIDYHYSDRFYSHHVKITALHFMFYHNRTNSIGGFSKRLFSLTGEPYDHMKEFTYSSLLLTKESFMERISEVELHKPIFEWCTWNLL